MPRLNAPLRATATGLYLPRTGSRRFAGHVTLIVLLLGAMGLSSLPGCVGTDPGPAPQGPSGATFTGPEYLYGTVGSLTRLSNNRPQIVSGFGLVVGLDNTGSNEVPAALRQWLLNLMAKYGVGQIQNRDLLDATPEEVLASEATSVVRVIGLIPPGAVSGTRFDLLVRAIDSRTTDLGGGQLWTTDMSPEGVNPQRIYTSPTAFGRGPVYVEPVDSTQVNEFALERQRRQGIVIDGGVVSESRRLELVLHQPSSRRARLMADRINERFPKAPGGANKTANAISPLVIQLSIPGRYQSNVGGLMNLINHLYVARSRNFVPLQAQRLTEKIAAQPDQAPRINWAWKALGERALPAVRRLYDAENLDIRLAALDAGTYLEDERASEHLMALVDHPDPTIRREVAQALANLPKSFVGERALKRLLNDENNAVRIAAYEALSSFGSALIQRYAVETRPAADASQVKFIIDRVPSEQSLIYISQQNVPRIVLFNPDMGFEAPLIEGVWDNRLMIRRMSPDQPASLMYQHRQVRQGRPQLVTETHKIQPTVATLAYVLGHQWNYEDPQEGFDLSYGQVVDALFQLVRKGAIDAEIEVSRSVLANLVRQTEDATPPQTPVRPETGDEPRQAASGAVPDRASAQRTGDP